MPANIAFTGELYGKTSTGKVVEGGSIVASNPPSSGKTIRVSSLTISNSTASVNADVIALVRRGGTPGASSIRLSGSSNLSIASNTGLSLSGNFTIEAWVYLISNNGTPMILDCRSEDSNKNYAFGINGAFYQKLYWVDEENGPSFMNSPIFFNRWTHVAAVKTGQTIRFYVDGIRDAVTVNSTLPMTDIATSPLIGKSMSGEYLNCYIEEIRVSNVARYSGDFFQVPASPFSDDEVNTVLLLHGDGSHNDVVFEDSVTSPHSVVPTNSARVVTTLSVFIGDEKRIAHRIAVPANSSLAVLDKPLYLEEGDRLVCLASTNERLEYVCSYEEIA